MNKKTKFFVCIILSISIMLSVMMSAFAVNESESNNTSATADRIYDDENNYGYISSTSDVDWWVISFDTDGMANFYLGSIPSGCDYDMYLYKNNGTTLIAASTSTSSELIRCRVYKNINYRIKIISYSGSSTTSKYKIRAKVYALQDAKFFTTIASDPNTEIDTHDTAEYSIPFLWNMGWTAGEYENNSANAAYTVLPTTDIFVSHNHGIPGRQLFNKPDGTNTYLYGNKTISSGEVNRALSNYSSGQLSEVDLIMFVGCELGLTSSSYGNMVDTALSKGAYCAIGWLNPLYDDVMNYWVGAFFEKCREGVTVADAIDYADSEIYNHPTYSAYYSSAINSYCGSSPYARLVIGGTN